MGGVSISGSYGDRKFRSGEVVFSNEMLVYAGDVCSTIDQCLDINDFHGVQGNNQLNRNLH